MRPVFRQAFGAAMLVAGLAGVAGGPAEAGPYRQVRDWWVSCDNALTCTMSFSASGNAGLPTVGLRRDDGPNAPVELVLPAIDGVSPPFAEGRYRFEIDGRTVLDMPLSGMQQKSGAYEMTGAPEGGLEALMDAMRAGTTMTVTRDLAGHEAHLRAPLSGVTAAMLFVDETQDRLKRTDALVASGGRKPPEQPPVRAIASVDALPEKVRAAFADGGPCSFFGMPPPTFDAFEYGLPEGGKLIGAQCGTGGAYNQIYAFFVRAVADASFERLGLPVMTAGGPSVDDAVFNIDFDPVKKQMTAFYKGRGLGDCGTFMRWRLETGNGARFVLVEQREKDDCDGDNAGGQEKWPTVWPR